MPSAGVEGLRAHAIAHSLFRPTTLREAIVRLGFVQADPIRAPARAQDLILRHRVSNYRAGDLERRYAELDLEEDCLNVYGFLPRETWSLLHPRRTRELTPLETRVLAFVKARGPEHPRDLVDRFGRERVVNDWGGTSNATTRALDRLHFLGFARITRRDGGIRVYEASALPQQVLMPAERLRRLALVFAHLLAPVPERTLQPIVLRLIRSLGIAEKRRYLREWIAEGALDTLTVEGRTYLWPAEPPSEPRSSGVKFLAPFDPVVWDRDRFEHLFGWEYRFEAYTPEHKRVRGYYALPLLWHDRVIGWANVRAGADAAIEVDLGFAGTEPKSRAFRSAVDDETRRMAAFLRPRRVR